MNPRFEAGALLLMAALLAPVSVSADEDPKKASGPVMIEGLFLGMTMVDVENQKIYRTETDEECAGRCIQFGECCSREEVEKYYALTEKDDSAVILRGSVAGQPARISMTFSKDTEVPLLSGLEIEFTKYRKIEPVMSTPMGELCKKSWGEPVEILERGDFQKAKFKTPFGNASLESQLERSPCRCPIGSKCDCRPMEFPVYKIVIHGVLGK